MTVPGKLRFLTKTLLFTSLNTLHNSKVSNFVLSSQTYVRGLDYNSSLKDLSFSRNDNTQSII